jgi:hypothetical protein
MARRDQSVGLGRKNTPQIRGTTQSVVYGTFIQVPSESHGSRGRHTQVYTHTFKEGCEYMHSKESYSHT